MIVNLVGYIIVFSLFFLFTSSVYAQATLNTKTNSVKVQVESEGETIINQETTSTSHSEVIIEQNGQVKRFESNGEPINYTSEDGSVNVDINSDTTEPKEAVSDVKGVDENNEKEEKKPREIKWIKKDVEKVLSAKDEEPIVVFETETFLKPSDIVKAVATTIPTPIAQVEKMFSLIQSTINLF